MAKRKKFRVHKYGALEFRDLKQGSLHWCQNNHTGYREKKAGNYEVSMAGWPAGFVCTPCMKEWVTIWEGIIK